MFQWRSHSHCSLRVDARTDSATMQGQLSHPGEQLLLPALQLVPVTDLFRGHRDRLLPCEQLEERDAGGVHVV